MLAYLSGISHRQDQGTDPNFFDRELAELLTSTVEQLKHPAYGLPATASGPEQHVIELSEKCSKTAADLLSEISKLKQRPGEGFRGTITKTVQALRKKTYMAETEKKLKAYEVILNIRILSQLDHRVLLQHERFDKLDTAVKDLVVALENGRNTYAELIADQTRSITAHFDRLQDTSSQQEASRRLRDEFVDSLFFPEMFARFDNIATSHDGTCQWFFKSTTVWSDLEQLGRTWMPDVHANRHSQAATSAQEVTANNNSRTSDSTSSRSPSHVNLEAENHTGSHPISTLRRRTWDSFEAWLENDGDKPYWLSGKPGSGKSTLMKYVYINFHDHCQSRGSSSLWGHSHDVLICSFFFWGLGSSVEKSYHSLLRSLLHQIARQLEDSIPIMLGKIRPLGSSMLHQWTEARLEGALKLFISWKPPTKRVGIFIDGLDEYEGDEEKLMDILRLLSQSPGIKVCVSSRPEEIFRQGFADCPHVRLQDLNKPDILKATSDRLTPALSFRFPDRVSDSFDSIPEFISLLTEKSQGVFLWAELMSKDILKGARNADTFSELQERLGHTPDTIDGLYAHMLGRLDRSYIHEAATYFHHIIAIDDVFSNSLAPRSPTLLDFACSKHSAWAHVVQRDTMYFLKTDFQTLCRNLEVRVLTRCAGLVDINESCRTTIPLLQSSSGHPVKINPDEAYLSRDLRGVNFIHKTARDYVRTYFKLLNDTDLRTCKYPRDIILTLYFSEVKY